MKPKTLSETPITMVELKSEIEKIKKRDGELNFRTNKTEEYLANFADVPVDTLLEIKKKIEALNISRLKPEYIIKIVDVMPLTINDLKLILQSYALTVTQDNLKKIVDVITEHIKPAK